MSARRKPSPECGRRLSAKESLVCHAGSTSNELTVLAIARYYFRSFAEPQSQAWMRALTIPRCEFGDSLGARIALGVLDMVREMRLARRTMFNFSNPECPCCANVLCETERHLMRVYSAVSRGQKSEAHAHALLLCEGNDPSHMLAAAEDLAALFEPKSSAPTPSRMRFTTAPD